MFDTQEVSPAQGDLSGTQPLPAWTGGAGSIHLLDRLNAVFKHRRLAGTAFLIVVALMMIQTYSTTPIYQTQSRIQIDDEKTTNLSNLNNTDLYWQDAAEYKKTQFQILRSRGLGLRVVQKLGLTSVAAAAEAPKAHDPISLLRDARLAVSAWLRGLFSKPPAAPAAEPPAPDRVRGTASIVNAFIAPIVIKPDADTRLVYIQYTHPDPDFAARAANTIADEYMQMNLEHRVENVNKLIKWVTGEVDKQGQLLADAEGALARYRETNNAMSLSRQDLLGQRLNSLTGQVSQAQPTRQHTPLLYDHPKNANPADDAIDAFPSIGANPAVVDARTAVRTAES